MNKGKQILVILLLLLPLLLGLGWGLWCYLDVPLDPGGKKEVKHVAVLPGTSFNEVASLLEKEGIIAGVKRFRLLAWLKGIEKQVKAGDYIFRTAMSSTEVLDTLVTGSYKTISVTIPEGFTVVQIASILQEKGLGESKTFLRLSSDPDFVRSLGIEGVSLEGFLFPDTYLFSKGMKEERILQKMVDRFNQVYKEEYKDRAAELGLSRKEVITLASIIEKETSDPSERYMIAAVFHNRLKKGMPLQSDPTVIYGIKNFNGNLTAGDLRKKTPYNTYLIKGLPPRPIANPGEESIRAALYPPPFNYLYFVSKNNGTHYFSTTLAEHNRAVDRYQRKRGGGRK